MKNRLSPSSSEPSRPLRSSVKSDSDSGSASEPSFPSLPSVKNSGSGSGSSEDLSLSPLPETALDHLAVTDPDTTAISPRALPRGINISGDALARATAHLPEDQRQLVRWACEYGQDQRWTYREAAAHYGVSHNALYRIFTDRYRDGDRRIPLDGVCAELARAKQLILERAAITRVPFIETTIFEKIHEVALEALVSQTIALIYGEPQIGKTASLKEVQRRHNHGTSKYIRVPAAGSVQMLVREIARACRLPLDRGFDYTRDRILNAVDGSSLLLVDEIHLVFITYNPKAILRSLEFLREIHDRTGCGMVLCGTKVFRKELETGIHSQFLKQIVRRGVLERQLPDVAPRADLDRIAAAYHLPPPTGDIRKLVDAVASQHGLSRYFKYLAITARSADKRKQPISWNHFNTVHKTLTAFKAE